MAKNNTAIILILLLIAGAFAYYYFIGSSNQNSMFSVNLYDAQGNKIKNNAFSIVNGVPGVASMNIGINVQNTGQTPLTCSLSGLTPTLFDSAVTKTSKTVQPGLATSWTSNLMNVTQFESLTQPVVFSATVTCSYTQGTNTINLPPKTGTISITITSDAAGSFTVNLGSNAGGTPTTCGNGVCEAGETTSTCPADCTVSSNVKFRTMNKALTQIATDAIAFTENCGNTLTVAGRNSGFYGSTTQTCATLMPAQGYTFMFATPAITSVLSQDGTLTSTTNPGLWKSGNYYAICADGTRPVVENFRTSIATTISSSPNIIDATKEVTC